MLFFVLLGSDVEIVVKPRPGQRAERECWSPETCRKFVYVFKLGLEATSGCLTNEPGSNIASAASQFPSLFRNLELTVLASSYDTKKGV